LGSLVAQIRGSWFTCIRVCCEPSLLDELLRKLPSSTRKILERPDPKAWYDEGHAVAVYEIIQALRPAPALRTITSEAAIAAMKGPWREMVLAMIGLLGKSPRMAFEQLPLLWNSTRRDAGELRCIESSAKHAITELSGFAYAESPAWLASWLGLHDALLQRAGFEGHAELEPTSDPSRVRVRIDW
jgi:hypothetical protein